MANKEIGLKKMSKKDLLELLVIQSKKIDELQKELDQTRELLESRQILIEEAGSIAEASLKLNNIFESAQKAADQYLDNIKKLEEKKNKKLTNSKKKKDDISKKRKTRKR